MNDYLVINSLGDILENIIEVGSKRSNIRQGINDSGSEILSSSLLCFVEGKTSYE